MKKINKVICLALAFVFLTTMMSACKPKPPKSVSSNVSSVSSGLIDDNSTATSSIISGSSTSNSSSTSSKKPSASNLFVPSTANKGPDPSEQKIDLKGYVFKVIGGGGTFSRTTGVSQADDARVKIIKDVETKLNCKIQNVDCAAGKFFQTYQSALLSGEKIGDIISPTMYEIGSFMSSGFLADMSKVPNLNMSKPYWNQLFKAVSTVKGKTYAANCELSSHLLGTSAIYFNKSLIKSLNLEDPYQLVDQKKWTIDKFIAMCQAAKKGTERYGLAAPDWKSIAFFMGSGLKILDVQNGRVVFNFKPEKTSPVNANVVNYLTKLRAVMIKGEISTPIDAGQPWTVTVDQFVQGKSLFFMQMIGTVADPTFKDKFLNMRDEYGLLPIPSAGVGQPYYNMVDWNVGVWGIPITNKDLSKTGIILDALAYHSYYDYNSVNINQFSDKYLRDDDSTRMLALIQNSEVYDLVFFAGVADERIKDVLGKIIVPSCENINLYEPAQAIPMYEDSVRKGVDAFFNS